MSTNIKHSDVVGRALIEGDIVASTAGGYASLKLFKVVGFSAKKIRVVSFNNENYRGKSGNSRIVAGKITTRNPEQVALVITGDERKMPEIAQEYKDILEESSNPF